VTGTKGNRRIDDPTDFVRIEIDAALSRNVRVIPVLVEGARMPLVEELPESMAGLVRRQAIELSPSRFAADLGRLIDVLDSMLVAGRSMAPTQSDVHAEPSVPHPPGERASTTTHRPVAVAAAVAVLALLVLGSVALGLIYQPPFLLAVTALGVWEGLRPGGTSSAEQMKRRGIALIVLGGVWIGVAWWTGLPELFVAGGIGLNWLSRRKE
jgi:hypothetical protein